MLGLSHILNIRKNYNSITSISDVDYKIYSQFGEDGIIDFILRKLNIEKPKFISGHLNYDFCKNLKDFLA